jgi:hypothetical protein
LQHALSSREIPFSVTMQTAQFKMQMPLLAWGYAPDQATRAHG